MSSEVCKKQKEQERDCNDRNGLGPKEAKKRICLCATCPNRLMVVSACVRTGVFLDITYNERSSHI